MFGKKDIVIDYDKVLDFIEIMVQIHFRTYMKPYINELIVKYESAKQELKDLCKEHERIIVNTISDEYTVKHVYYYLSVDGYVRTIHSLLYQHVIDYTINQIDERSIARTGT